MILLPYNFTQAQFDKAVEQLQDIVIRRIERASIAVIGPRDYNTPITLVSGYMDIEVDASGAYDCPHFWYNKKELDKRGIIYVV